jgi:hypothetical protein
MTLYTIVDPELIWQQDAEVHDITREEIEYDGILLEVTRYDDKTVIINRIISTNPNDYMKPYLQPGIKMKYTFLSQE